MLKFAGKFEVGQVIRGYDFPGRTDCYIEGPVLEARYVRPHDGVHCYRIAITKQMFGGEDITKPNDEGYIPHGVSLFEYDTRIEGK